jgi:hypothetical protein
MSRWAISRHCSVPFDMKAASLFGEGREKQPHDQHRQTLRAHSYQADACAQFTSAPSTGRNRLLTAGTALAKIALIGLACERTAAVLGVVAYPTHVARAFCTNLSVTIDLTCTLEQLVLVPIMPYPDPWTIPPDSSWRHFVLIFLW